LAVELFVVIPQTLLDGESRLFLIRTGLFEFSVLSFRRFAFCINLFPKSLAFHPKSAHRLGLYTQLALRFRQIVQKQKTDAEVLVLSKDRQPIRKQQGEEDIR
jgi:hypothetical protein